MEIVSNSFPLEQLKQYNVILLCGKAGSGKDFTYKCIEDLYYNDLHKSEYSIVRYAFADKVKHIAKELGWNGNKDTLGRYCLQQIGALGRKLNPNIWIEYVLHDIVNTLISSNSFYSCPNYNAPKYIFVITDCRFQNELALMKTYFHAISIEITGRQSDLGENSQDISEHDLDNVKKDYTILNKNITKETLKTHLHSILLQEGMI